MIIKSEPTRRQKSSHKPLLKLFCIPFQSIFKHLVCNAWLAGNMMQTFGSKTEMEMHKINMKML